MDTEKGTTAEFAVAILEVEAYPIYPEESFADYLEGAVGLEGSTKRDILSGEIRGIARLKGAIGRPGWSTRGDAS